MLLHCFVNTKKISLCKITQHKMLSGVDQMEFFFLCSMRLDSTLFSRPLRYPDDSQ